MRRDGAGGCRARAHPIRDHTFTRLHACHRSADRSVGPLSGHARATEMPIQRADVFDVERLYDKIVLRLMPFLVLLFVVAWLDRINVGFARLQMAKDLGFSDAAFGFGAGIFYLGYLIFEIPSNLLLE